MDNASVIISENLEQSIATIPGEEGWWESENKDTFLEATKMLIAESNLSEENIIDLLSKLYGAVAAEFGS